MGEHLGYVLNPPDDKLSQVADMRLVSVLAQVPAIDCLVEHDIKDMKYETDQDSHDC